MTKRITLIFLGVILLSLTGCQTVKDARKAQKEDGRLPGESTKTAAESGLRYHKKWTAKAKLDEKTKAAKLAAEKELSEPKPMDLQELEKIALKCNPGVLQASEDVKLAEIDVQLAKANYLPVLGSSLGYKRETANYDRHNQRSNTTGEYSMGLDFNLLIYDFGKTDAKVKLAQNILEAKKQSLRLAKNTVVYQVRLSFFALKRAIELDLVAQMSEKQYKEHLDQMLMRYKVGSGTKYSCTKAEVDWNNSVLIAITTQNNIMVAYANLNKALGLAEHVEYDINAGEMPKLKLDSDFLMTIAREKDPVYLANKMMAKAASNLVDQYIAELYPDFSLNLGGTLTNDAPGIPLLWNFFGLGSLTQNVFNGGRNMLAIQAAVASLRIARSQMAAREQTVYRDLREATLNAIRSQKQLDVAIMAEKQAQENLDIVTEQFNVGRASSIERTDAQVAHSQSKAFVVSAKYDYQDSLAKLYFVMGINAAYGE
ncbi:MAG: TolC family protein [Lentisphaeria bacterium]